MEKRHALLTVLACLLLLLLGEIVLIYRKRSELHALFLESQRKINRNKAIFSSEFHFDIYTEKNNNTHNAVFLGAKITPLMGVE